VGDLFLPFLVDCLGLLFGEELPTLTESASTLHVIGTEGVIQGGRCELDVEIT